MSVGIQRLRDDADAIRKGARDKGEDPGLVDTALGLDAERRKLLGDVDGWRAERKHLSAEVGAAMKGGGNADALKGQSVELGARIEQAEERLGQIDATRTGTTADPEPAGSDVPVGSPERR